MRIYCKTLRLSVCFLALLCFVSVGYAVQPSDDVHFCRVLDFEDMQDRDSLYAATKRALNLNVGEPRTVRMIYFLPNDRPFRQEVVDSMKVTIRQVQTFFAEQMQAHGYGNKTFRFETDAQGEPMVHRVDGQHPDSHYHDNTTNTVFGETQQVFDPSLNIYLIVIDNGTMFISEGGWKIGGTGGYWGRNGGLVVIPDRFHWKTAAHELGHAFGLRHDFRDSAYIMSFGAGQRPSISACAAEYLVVHTYFNPDIPIEEAQSPTIELLSPLGYPAGSKSVPVKLKVSDSDGLHQVIRFVITSESGIVGKGLEVKACRGLDGEQDIVIEFEYDGVIPSGYGTSLANSVVHGIAVMAIDIVGDVSEEYFELWEISPHHIATLEEHAREISSVVFSPDGKILASGSYDNTVKLWDVATGASLSTLEGHEYVVYSVAFSPDGKTLASGSSDRTIKLWDVATGANIATLKGYGLEVSSVAFSPDGQRLLPDLMITRLSCGMLRCKQISPRLRAILVGLALWRILPTAGHLLPGLMITRLSCGMLRRAQISLPLRNIRVGWSLWHFLSMVQCSLLGHGIIRSSCGMLRRAQISLRLRDIWPGSSLWHFLPMGKRSLQDHGIEQVERSSYGMLQQGTILLPLRGMCLTSPL